jgi:hypothetical protein
VTATLASLRREIDIINHALNMDAPTEVLVAIVNPDDCTEIYECWKVGGGTVSKEYYLSKMEKNKKC